MIPSIFNEEQVSISNTIDFTTVENTRAHFLIEFKICELEKDILILNQRIEDQKLIIIRKNLI